ncbi:UDP-glucose 6-dehydrogenase [Thermosipho africanus Ob7]|jgi:UDPglucose 6-dehydrogenase|uniref:UDP-glucose 6-dehydrogenase n=1 Tax=Thermosipho africanus (strain TCF52B) TaxID=484019 RepID=B7IGX9_THEAB|nr:nucleotide sugar dehydrogenase [Thermosipho africanus]ACJ75343.1 UDP-glucose 6-dehydrogenase [Thermosipho africanus TCF52B]RDI90813.1 UDP-glucose 6-dehydrogenase [Thermosipho africanus Ob7]
MKISVVGLGYVGLSIAVLISQNQEVIGLDISEDKVKKINNKISPIKDKEIIEYLKHKNLNLTATTDKELAYKNAEMIFIATPTDYNPETNYFDTSSVDEVIEDVLKVNEKALIVIKSTIPIGYTERKRREFNTDRIIFSPEFLREGKALYDNLYPSRIVVGDKTEKGEKIARLLLEGAIKKDVPVFLMDSTEAEAVKLFANTYLAMRVAFFNELDTFAEIKGLNTLEIIKGVCSDPRIGDFYNNPSFGYGGYCLPKDTKQILADYLGNGVPHILIRAIVESNTIRKKHIAEMIASKKPKLVGIYRLAMKKDSDNFRHSSILDVIDYLKEKGVNMIIYEPIIKEDNFKSIKVERDFEKFISVSDLIVANRLYEELKIVKEKVYTRDLFERD